MIQSQMIVQQHPQEKSLGCNQHNGNDLRRWTKYLLGMCVLLRTFHFIKLVFIQNPINYCPYVSVQDSHHLSQLSFQIVYLLQLPLTLKFIRIQRKWIKTTRRLVQSNTGICRQTAFVMLLSDVEHDLKLLLTHRTEKDLGRESDAGLLLKTLSSNLEAKDDGKRYGKCDNEAKLTRKTKLEDDINKKDKNVAASLGHSGDGVSEDFATINQLLWR